MACQSLVPPYKCPSPLTSVVCRTERSQCSTPTHVPVAHVLDEAPPRCWTCALLFMEPSKTVPAVGRGAVFFPCPWHSGMPSGQGSEENGCVSSRPGQSVCVALYPHSFWCASCCKTPGGRQTKRGIGPWGRPNHDADQRGASRGLSVKKRRMKAKVVEAQEASCTPGWSALVYHVCKRTVGSSRQQQ